MTLAAATVPDHGPENRLENKSGLRGAVRWGDGRTPGRLSRALLASDVGVLGRPFCLVYKADIPYAVNGQMEGTVAQTEDQRAKRAARDRASDAKRRSNPEYREKHNAKKKVERALKRATDPAFKAAQLDLARQWRLANPERVRELHRAWRAANPARAKEHAKAKYERQSDERRLYSAARSRALAKGLEFSIVVEDIVVPDKCPVLGIPLERHKCRARANSPSLDRIDPQKGYVASNIQVISNRANTLKNNATIEELEIVLAHMRRLHGRTVRLVEPTEPLEQT